VTQTSGLVSSESAAVEATVVAGWQPPDSRRMLQLCLAAAWLLDGVLQLQPFMFTHGFGAMLRANASGNPPVVARTITWNAAMVAHHSVAADASFAAIQVLLGLGIAWRATLRPALGVSIAWSLSVWWFGEGLGGVLSGRASPIGGGPGAVLCYGLLAMLLWPADRAGSASPFTAARSVGIKVAKAVWVALWGGLAVLSLTDSSRSPEYVRDMLSGLAAGEPGWLAALDHDLASSFAGRGAEASIGLAVIFLVLALGVFLPVRPARAVTALAVAVCVAIWVLGENFGAIFGGGQATDPNSGLLFALVAASYWPVRTTAATRSVPAGAFMEAA